MTGAFPVLQNDRILRAARGEPVDRVPVWLHRQAGRYLPEFRAVRQNHDFFEICTTPELACQITLQPIDRFPLDAAIIFSDILVVPQALGLQVEMVPSIGPNFPDPLRSPSDLSRLKASVDVNAELGYVFEAITLTRHRLNGRVPLIGFSGAPFTLMAYCIEGRGSKTLSLAKKWLFAHPDDSHVLLQKLTDVIVDYLVGQARAGAQMLEVFDTWAGMLAPDEFSLFCLPYLKQISKRVKSTLADQAVPMIIFAKDAHYALEDLAQSGYDVMSLDWTIPPQQAVARVDRRVSLQGNADPCVIYADTGVIKKKAQEMVASFAASRGYIANLGHGCYPDFDPDHVAAYIDAIHDCPVIHS